MAKPKGYTNKEQEQEQLLTNNQTNQTERENTMSTNTNNANTANVNTANNTNDDLDPLAAASRESDSHTDHEPAHGSNLNINWEELNTKIEQAEVSIVVSSLPPGNYLMTLKHAAMKTRVADKQGDYDSLWLNLTLKVVAELDNRFNFEGSSTKGNVINKSIFLVGKNGVMEWGLGEFKTFLKQSDFRLNGKTNFNPLEILSAQNTATSQKTLSIWDDIEGKHFFFKAEEYKDKQTGDDKFAFKLVGVPTEAALNTIMTSASMDAGDEVYADSESGDGVKDLPA